MADALSQNGRGRDACENLTFSQIQKLKAKDLQTCKTSIREHLANCRANINTKRRHTVRGGDTLAKILGTQVFYNKRIVLNGNNLGKRPNVALKLGDMLTIKGNACSKVIEIKKTKNPTLRMAMDVGPRMKKLSKDLRGARTSIL